MLSVLIIGCGAIAGGHDAARPDDAWPRTHAAAYRRDGGFRLAACVDPDAARREAFARRWTVEAQFASLPEASAAGPFDIISICSPTHAHVADLEAAIGLQPRLVFCEKPVTPSLGETTRLVKLARARGVGFAVNHTRRWAPDVRALAAELRAGAWGEVRGASAVYNKGVLNNGSHLFDLLSCLFGGISVVAAGLPVIDFSEADPSVPCLLQTSAGVPVSVTVAHAADYALFELTLITERAVITMEDGGAQWRVRPVVDSQSFPGYRALASGAFRPGRYDEAMANAVAEFRLWLDGKADLSSTGETAAAAQAISDAVLARAGAQ
jgi:predicted dehydrogenase